MVLINSNKITYITSRNGVVKHPTSDALLPIVQSIYPTLDTLQDVVNLAKESLPTLDENSIHALLMTYHNTLLDQLNNEQLQYG